MIIFLLFMLEYSVEVVLVSKFVDLAFNLFGKDSVSKGLVISKNDVSMTLLIEVRMI